jgi:hypothetical protein
MKKRTSMRIQANQLLEQGKERGRRSLCWGRSPTSYADRGCAYALDARGLLIRFDRKPMPFQCLPIFWSGPARQAAGRIVRGPTGLAALCRVGGRLTDAQKSFEELAKEQRPAVRGFHGPA